MHYSLNDLIVYIKANWKHVLAGVIVAYAAQHFGAPGSERVGAILHIFGLY